MHESIPSTQRGGRVTEGAVPVRLNGRTATVNKSCYKWSFSPMYKYIYWIYSVYCVSNVYTHFIPMTQNGVVYREHYRSCIPAKQLKEWLLTCCSLYDFRPSDLNYYETSHWETHWEISFFMLYVGWFLYRRFEYLEKNLSIQGLNLFPTNELHQS